MSLWKTGLGLFVKNFVGPLSSAPPAAPHTQEKVPQGPVLPAPQGQNIFYDAFEKPREWLKKSPGLRSVLKYGGYPGVIASTLGGSCAALESGFSQNAIFLGAIGMGGLATVALENLIPYREDWVPRSKEMKLDLVHNMLSSGVIPGVFKKIVFGAFLALGLKLSSLLGLGEESFWSALHLNSLPLLLQSFTVLVLGEFGAYWTHRMMHENPKWWPIHEIHHSSERLTALHAGRVHPLDILRMYFFFLAFGLMGVPSGVFLMSSIFIGVHVFLQHSNADLELGPLEYVLAGPKVHRWHHSVKASEGNHNYGNYFLLWDHVSWGKTPFFGKHLKVKGPTFYLPKDRAGPKQLGVRNLNLIDENHSALFNWWQHFLHPFKKLWQDKF